MDQMLISKFQELIQQGEKLVPEGGLEFSGYNAKMQSQYLVWRKNCLDALSKVGEKANAQREKITKDENGAYFYQTTAQLILESMKHAQPFLEAEAKKNPTPPPPPSPPKSVAPKAEVQPLKSSVKTDTSTQKQDSPKSEAPEPVQLQKQVFVLSSSESELQNQLTVFLKEISIEPIVFKRTASLDAIIEFIEKHPRIAYAYYLFNAEDLNNAMFELGYLVGKIGSYRIVCIHKKEVAPPKGVPGISYKEIVVKLEEISFGLIKDLKSAGFSVSI